MARTTKAKRPAEDRPSKEALSESFIRTYFERVFSLVDKAIEKGVANNVMGLMAMAMLNDLLHGGAYAVPVNQRPYFMDKPEQSPYYAGPLQNTEQGAGIAGFFASLFAGQNAGDIWKQIMTDANVPHVLPKVISDEQYAQFYILYSQMASTELFQSAGTGLKTIVEAAEEAIGENPASIVGRQALAGGRRAATYLRGALAASENADEQTSGGA